MKTVVAILAALLIAYAVHEALIDDPPVDPGDGQEHSSAFAF